MAIVHGPQAREMTAEERAERAERCFELEQRIKEQIARGREALWDLSESMYQFNAQSGWTALGHEDAAEWLAQPEIGMTKSMFYRLVRRHKELVLMRHVPLETLVQCDPFKLDLVLPYVEENQVTLTDALTDVVSLGARDLREKYIGARAAAKAEPEPSGGADTVDGQLTPEHEALRHAASVVDSWIYVGGDRRKPQRQLPRLLEIEPTLAALERVRACVAGAGGAPRREDIREDWELVVETLDLPLES
jgi:hypothetical protein